MRNIKIQNFILKFLGNIERYISPFKEKYNKPLEKNKKYWLDLLKESPITVVSKEQKGETLINIYDSYLDRIKSLIYFLSVDDTSEQEIIFEKIVKLRENNYLNLKTTKDTVDYIYKDLKPSLDKNYETLLELDDKH